MSNKLFKSIFAVAMVLGAAFGFASCTPQDEPADADPKVEVSKTALTFSNAEGSDTLDVTATAGWKTEVAVDWVTVAPATGNGNKTITVSVSANDTGAKRETVLKIHANHPVYGKWDTKKVTIIQSANEEVAVEEVALYSDDFDGEEVTKTYGNGSQYPYIDQFPEFVNKKGEASANVTYTGSGVSVRVVSDGGSAGSHSDYKGSGVNNIFFGTAPTYFVVNNISPLSVDQKNYKITFGTEKYEQNKENIVSGDELVLSISKDGLAWVPVSYTFAGTEPGNWNVATAEFTLTAGVEAIYIRFDCNYSSAYRIDDLKFSIGNGGQTIDLDSVEAPEPAETITIAEALAVGQGNTINGAIEGIVISNMDLNNLTSKKGMYVQDETGALQFYLGANHTFAFGTKVRIDLTGVKLAEYNGAVQVSGIGLDKITTISTDNTVEPKSVTMADFLANKYEGQYIALEGVQVAAADLAKTWVVGGAHTSINMTDVDGNKFVVFSSKYATYGTQTVAQGAGTIKGISSISNGAMQIIFAQATDYAGLTGERFTEPETPENPEPEPGEVVKATVAEFLAAAEGNTIYELTGVITSVANTTYGNFYLKDDTGEVYIYGLCSPEGEQKYWAESGVKVGDTITVQTVRTSYDGTPQGKNAIYVSHVSVEVEEPEIPEGCVEASIVFVNAGYANAESVDGKSIALDNNVSVVFSQGGAGTAPAYYTSGEAIRMYQNGATLDVTANGKSIKSIELTFSNNQYYLAANCGELSEEAAVRTWTGDATAVQFTSTGTDKSHRAYVSAIKVIYAE